VKAVFLLSPANTAGVRAGFLLNPKATFALARQFQGDGLPLGEAFSFASGLYFRGKLAYARRFAGPEDRVRVITTNAGLVDPARRIRPADLRGFAEVDIETNDERYLGPLRRSARALARQLDPGGLAVLLGSIATAKYREILLEVFGDRLVFPADFIGRGDMSRGALLLHAAEAGQLLPYLPVRGTVLHGKRAASWKTTLSRTRQ